MSASPILLRLHLLVILAFLLFYALKAALLLLNRHEQLRALRARTRIADSLLGFLILLTGGILLGQYPGPTPAWLWVKLGLVLVLLPAAIAAMRRQFKPGVVLTLLGFFYVYGLAETGSLSLSRPTEKASYATTPGLAEATATPDAEAPARLAEDSAQQNSAPEPEFASTDGLVQGKALYLKNCAACHGADGRLGVNGAHDLSASNLNATGRVYMVNNGVALNGVVKMPSFKDQLTPEQIEQVVAYSLTLK
ncbi:c-type cytochrome [Hymenobacter fodinae]|uniref:C-type cytochrome n=1 Tax=Hymenobacter fodinae TaxID=2510796 RepID=A0A4Z0PBH3_9BACT|nr:cytochrome c [Hymenobacter fodinae]TGE09792.1 c-type cytochrome [Hymenobacter fodinae]